MAHRSLSTLVFAGLVPTTAATVISLLGDEGLPSDIRIVQNLMYQPWQASRSGLLIMGMDPTTDLAKVSMMIQDRTTWWEVAVCLSESISAYEPALLAQGAVKILPHPEDDLTAARDELRNLLEILTVHGTDILGLELSDLIQLYGEKRIPKTIRVSGQGVIGSMYLRDGMVVHADTMDDDQGMSAFSRMFAVRAPEIRVHNGCLTTKNSMNMPVMSALLEGARVNDEDKRDEPATSPTMAPSGNDVMDALGDILDDFDFGGSNVSDHRPEPQQRSSDHHRRHETPHRGDSPRRPQRASSPPRRMSPNSHSSFDEDLDLD